MTHTNKQNGVRLHFCKTDKFKDVTISLRFSKPLNQTNATVRSLLGMMLVDRTQKYNTKLSMQRQLDYLYGANLYHKITGYGTAHVLEIKLQVINERYTNQPLLENQFALLHEVIFAPLLTEESFQEAKRLLKEKFDRSLDTPAVFASKRLLELAANDQPLAIDASGNPSLIGSITLQQVQKEYDSLINENMVDCFVVGDYQETRVSDFVDQYLNLHGNQNSSSFYHLQKQEFNRVVEQMQIQQTVLSQLYRTGINIADDDYWALRITNALLGVYPTSLLFQEVREKRSLCYSIYSSIIAYDGALVIQTGINKENVELVEELIKQQMVRLQNGDFNDDLLQTTKEMMMNGLKTIEDDVSSIIGLRYQNVLLNRQNQLLDFIHQIAQVSKEDVMRIAKQLELQCTFVLQQED
ncbi:MAG: pitrilysin family protein [Erysipelotrichaceae bacterium]|nr:pitrilysin family protein [Erysipelotrichaceae bacterium]